MNSCIFLLLCSLFSWMCPFAAGSCSSYTTIDEPKRHASVPSSLVDYYSTIDDANKNGIWLRFVGDGGDVLALNCPPFQHGYTQNAISYEGSYADRLSHSGTFTACGSFGSPIEVMACPGDFSIYQKNTSPPNGRFAFLTAHSDCSKPNVCGTSPLVYCDYRGLCVCIPGYTFSTTTLMVAPDYLCVDIDECATSTPCGPNADCTNFVGGFNCTCHTGFGATDDAKPVNDTNPCTDVDECLEPVCGEYGICSNTVGSYTCACPTGFEKVTVGITSPCQDTDECLDTTICGPNSVCTNEIGYYDCACQAGFSTFNTNPPDIINACQDIDECSETPDLCGTLGVCTNVHGAFHCTCLEGAYPSTGVLWTMSVTYCTGQTKEVTFLLKVDLQLRGLVPNGYLLPEEMVANCLAACMEAAGVGHRVDPVRVSSAGDGESGSLIQDISKLLMITVIPPDRNWTLIQLTTRAFDWHLYFFGPGIYKSSSASLSANGNLMEINMESLGRNNNGSAAVVFLVLHGLESLLSHQFFETENLTEIISDVITAVLPKMNNTELTEPVNFTLMHHRQVHLDTTEQLIESLIEEGDGDGEAYYMEWSEEGCWVSYTNENYTVCSCSHLSTFALILQTGEPPPQSDFLDWLNRICVIIGLFFFALAILTFLLCSWNPKINNTARLHLCLNLGLSHLLLLFNDVYVANKRACKAMAGILHFLVVASFVWMLLEAVQLYILVRRLNKVQVIERDGLPMLALFLIGYGVPMVIVGVSALVYHPGYGAIEAKVCWLSQTRNFNWALTGPVICVLLLNFMLFCGTLLSLRTTLINMRSGASDSKDTKLVLFKIVAQFVILGCTWILGLYQTNLFFQILFIVLNSQQGTFLYFVHCVLNKEIREECLKCFTCSHKKKEEKTEAVSATEQTDITD